MKKLSFAVFVTLLFVSAFTGCNIYEHEEVEIIRCPQIQDTVQIPGWEHPDNSFEL